MKLFYAEVERAHVMTDDWLYWAVSMKILVIANSKEEALKRIYKILPPPDQKTKKMLEKDSKKMGLNNEAIKFYRINLSGGSEFTNGILEYSEINYGKTVHDINPVLIQPIKLSWITEK